MKKVACDERPGWRSYAESVGFEFHTFDGEPYWDETAYYQFNLRQIEQDLEEPTEELHQMALALVDDIIRDEEKLQQLAIPEKFWDFVAGSWRAKAPSLYGRLDLVYDGTGPAKLLELNYDTPTSLFETGFFQWVWLEDQIMRGKVPQGADQFNSLQDQLEAAFTELPLANPLYFASVANSIEDKGTVMYLMDIAKQAGLDSRFIELEQLGEASGQLVDLDGYAIGALFKLYPWEFMVQEDFASVILSSQTQWLEPGWKMLLSNKGILPLLWQKHQGHPNLLESHFEQPGQSFGAGWVRKPLFSREGANVELVTQSGEKISEPGPYADSPFIRQKFQPLPKFGDSYSMIGSWVVGNSAAGIGIREDNSLITKDSSRFLPHIIVD
ncbi:MAG: glutathionylspermidine synthase family protein [Gammaproteobacteria bacterium]|nr:glutathionylspermidine synthase family protein [Gammaproteobacteria bacterium]MBU2059585.1 glutathionylspermidine synthase family protein [Gammaproteobacteria bacterium]MBU2174432.1 glutathionylspermidine synthase family protein [Gammaproteobacteria bacterium]MBU2248057.1 glutathionylspermidine synthase family protein [Gammaproteobacteria bacterium]MBU2345527.1 glutathionylspermidine synthase family protein [Gammaproteobacteria bacterium]